MAIAPREQRKGLGECVLGCRPDKQRFASRPLAIPIRLWSIGMPGGTVLLFGLHEQVALKKGRFLDRRLDPGASHGGWTSG
jgi:hypothetical protein